jgi:hypothetical protein
MVPASGTPPVEVHPTELTVAAAAGLMATRYQPVQQQLDRRSLLQKNINRDLLKTPSKAGRNFNCLGGINRGGRFLLTEAVTRNRLAKSIYETVPKIY